MSQIFKHRFLIAFSLFWANIKLGEGDCCPTLRITATGPAKIEQSTKLGTYEYYKQGINGKEIYKQIGGQHYLYFETTFNEWMIGSNYTSRMRGISHSSCKNEICPSSCSSKWEYYDSGWKDDTTIQVKCDWSKLNELVNLDQELKNLKEDLNELKLMAESNLHAINDTLIPDVVENYKKSEDIQREVDEIHDNILEMKMNGASGSATNKDFSSCKDEKVWCKMADCSLTSVAKKCQKTCGSC